ILASEIVSVLAHVDGADQNGAGGLQARDEGRVPRRGSVAAVDLGTGHRRQSIDIKKIFHREWHARHWLKPLSLAPCPIDGLGLRTRAAGDDISEGVELWIKAFDALERGFGNGKRTAFAVRDGACNLRGAGP